MPEISTSGSTETSIGIKPPRKYGYLNLIGIKTLIDRELRREIRFFGAAVIGPAIQAALFATMFVIILGDNVPEAAGIDYLAFLATGFIATSFMQKAFESTAFSLMFDKLEGNLDDLLSAPISGFEILVSYTLASTAVTLVIGTTVWAVLIPLGGPGLPIHILELSAGIILGCSLFSSAGVLATIFSEKWDKLSAKETFVLAPLMFLSGSFFPRSVVGEDFQFLMDYNPVFRLVESIRFGFTGAHELPIWNGLGLTAAWAVAIWAVTLVILSTGYKLKP